MYQELAALVQRINEAPTPELWREYWIIRAKLDWPGPKCPFPESNAEWAERYRREHPAS